MSSERARWRVNAQSFIGHALVAAGAEVFYTPPEGGHVGHNLSPLNDTAQAIVDAQKPDHPDKASNAGKRAKALADRQAADETAEKESTDGIVKGAKGDTRTNKAPRGGKRAAQPAAEGDTEADKADENDLA